MYKRLLGLMIALELMSPSLSKAKELLVPTAFPEPGLTTIRLSPRGEVVQIGFADGSVIDNPEVDAESLRDIDLLEIYNIPIDLWFIRTEAGIGRYDRTPASRAYRSADTGQDFIVHLDENAQPYKVTDVEGNELPVEEAFLADLDGGKADVLGYRTFTMIDYRIDANGEVLRRILRPSAIGPIPAE